MSITLNNSYCAKRWVLLMGSERVLVSRRKRRLSLILPFAARGRYALVLTLAQARSSGARALPWEDRLRLRRPKGKPHGEEIFHRRSQGQLHRLRPRSRAGRHRGGDASRQTGCGAGGPGRVRASPRAGADSGSPTGSSASATPISRRTRCSPKSGSNVTAIPRRAGISPGRWRFRRGFLKHVGGRASGDK